MKKRGSHVLSKKTGRMRKAGAPNARRSGRPVRCFEPKVERWFAIVETEFPSSRSSIVPMLLSAQAALDYLPRDAMQAIARHLVVPTALVEGVASFYSQFRFTKPGRHRVTVCTGTACYVRGGGKLMDELQKDLKIAPGETTADGAVSLETVSCLSACALAPIVILDDEVLRKQTSASMKTVIQDISADSSKDGSSGPSKGKSARRSKGKSRGARSSRAARETRK